MTPNKEIFAQFQVEAIHSWPNAEGENAFLANPQRHLFEVRVSCPAKHNGINVTRAELLEVAKNMLKGGNWGTASCETVAENLAQELVAKFSRTITVELGTSNNEFGAFVQLVSD